MKNKIKILICLIIFLPFVVNARTCDLDKVSIESVDIDNTYGTVIEKEDAIIDKNNITFDLKMSNIKDSITYKIKIKNNSNEDLILDNNSIKGSPYISYSFENNENSIVIGSNSTKEVSLLIKYENEVPNSMFTNGNYDDNNSLILDLTETSIINPKTGIFNYAVVIIIGIIMSLSFYFYLRNKKAAALVLLILISPVVLKADCKYNIVINSNVNIYNKAEFNIGITVNDKLRRLAVAGDGSLKSFKRSNTLPENIKVLVDNKIEEINNDALELVEADFNEYIESVHIISGFFTKDEDGVKYYCEKNNQSEYCMSESDLIDELYYRIVYGIKGDDGQSTKYLYYNEDKNRIEITDDMTRIKNVMIKYVISYQKKENIDNLISSDSSKYNIYAWYDQNDGSINYYCENDMVYFNKDSSYFFYGMDGLVSVPGLGSINTSNVINMSNMFYNCKSLTTIDLSHFDTSNVTSMEGMFYNCNLITRLNLNNFDTSKVTSMNKMFCDCINLTSLLIDNFNTSNVTDMRYMFSGCNSLTALDLRHFDTSKVTSMYYMFCDCKSLESLNLSSFNTSNVIDMGWMFYGLKNLTTLDLSSFDTRNVESMRCMFAESTGLENIDISSFRTPNLIDMTRVFGACSNLTSIDLSNFDTSKVTTMNQLFNLCSKLNDINISSFDTSKVTTMSYMFNGCGSLTSLDLRHFNTDSLTTMNQMFGGMDNLVTVDLSSFNTTNVTDMNRLFRYNKKLENIYVSERWNVENLTEAGEIAIFQSCIKLPNFSASYTNKTRAHYGEGGYLKYKAFN